MLEALEMKVNVQARPVEMVLVLDGELTSLGDGSVSKPRESLEIKHELLPSNEDPQGMRCEGQDLTTAILSVAEDRR